MDWDYSQSSPFCHLPAFDPKTFYFTGTGTGILHNPIGEAYSYFSLPPKLGYRLFTALDPRTSKEDFISTVRKEACGTTKSKQT